MKNTVISKITNWIIVIFLLYSCKANHKESPVEQQAEKMAEILLKDSTATSIQFSPLDSNKVWVIIDNKDQEIIEIDLKTKQVKPISEKIKKLFTYQNDYELKFKSYLSDPFEPIVWIIDWPSNKIIKYNKLYENIQEPGISITDYNTNKNIIPINERVYFKASEGFCYWDRKQKIIKFVKGIPLYISWFVRPDEKSIIINDSLTYNLYTGEVKRGSFLGNMEVYLIGDSYNACDGTSIFKKDNRLFIKKDESITMLPDYFKMVKGINIYPAYLTQFTNNGQLEIFQIKTQNITFLNYDLPMILIPIKETYNADYIWYSGENYLFFISVSDGLKYYFPVKQKEGFRDLLLYKNFVILLYKNKLIIKNKHAFILSSLPYEPDKYKKELDDFHDYANTIWQYKDSSGQSVIEKIKITRLKYAETDNVGIIDELSTLGYGILSDKPKVLEFYCSNNEIPLNYRKECLSLLMEQSILALKIKKAMSYYYKYKSILETNAKDYYFSKEIALNLTKYIHAIDSISMCPLPQDSTSFYKATAIGAIQFYNFYNWEEYFCFGCRAMNNALEKFVKAYPKSQLADNALFMHIDNEECCSRHPYSFKEQLIKDYKKILYTYPDSELKPEIEYKIINYTYEPVLLKKACLKFLKEFPDNEYSEDVKRRLNEIYVNYE